MPLASCGIVEFLLLAAIVPVSIEEVHVLDLALLQLLPDDVEIDLGLVP